MFKENYDKTKKGTLPMIMTGSAITAGEVKSDEELINILVENLGLERRATATAPPSNGQ